MQLSLHNRKPKILKAWGSRKMIDGARCRQCLFCLKWFHIGWIAYHGCKVKHQ